MGPPLIQIPIPVGFKGFVKVETVNIHTGEKTFEGGWGPNAILHTGREYMGENADWMTYCQVGNSGDLPVQTDTALKQWVAGDNNIISDQTGAQSSAPYYGWRRRKWRLDPSLNSQNENIAELGFGWEDGDTNPATIMCRTFPVNITGDQTTVTWKDDEYLDVSYELRYYPPDSDVTGQVTIDSLVYDYTLRASEVNSATYWGEIVGVHAMGEHCVATTDWQAYDGNIGSVIQTPTGSTAPIDDPSNVSNNAYVPLSYKRVMVASIGPTVWNLGAGIRSVRFRTTGGTFQIQFDRDPGGETIPKTSGETMEWQLSIAWAEKVL